MRLEELLQEAESRSIQLGEASSLDGALERLQNDCARFFEHIPEPPLYRRAQDPARQAAAAKVPEARELLARCLALSRGEGNGAPLELLSGALKAHLAALCHTATGQLEAAEDAWRNACALERQVASARRLWVRSDETPLPVYDRAGGVSRYDPRPAPLVKARLVCVHAHCRRGDEYAFSPWRTSHRFECPACLGAFSGYFAGLESLQVEERGRQLKGYRFKVEESGGGLARIEFEDASGADFSAARRELLAFLYTERRELRAVLNLSTSQQLWLHRGGCFVATVAFGEGAPELAAFRSYRDRVLMRGRIGRLLVRGYYRAGPSLARRLAQSPRAKGWVRRMLGVVHRALVRSGYS